MRIEYFKSKLAGVREIKRLGYTVFVETSESGDHGWGSREYYAKPGTDLRGNVSKVGRQWAVSIPEDTP